MTLSTIRKIPADFEKTYISATSAALARSHRLIRIERAKELLFLSICTKIKLDNFKEERSIKQKDARRQKRKNHRVD
jgi:hypothetical protein